MTTRPPEERFWPKVDKSGGPDACWPWMGYRNRQGYGTFALTLGSRGRHTPEMSHRVAVILTAGPIPDGMLVLHSCDNPPCCNPAHLSIGTDADNARDMVARGRSAAGEASPRAKLNSDAVRAIRAATERTSKSLAAEYSVSQSLISRVRRREAWKLVA